MTGESETGESHIEQPVKHGRKRRRRGLVLLGIVVAAAGIVFGAVEYAPSMLARYLVRNYFQGLDIDTSGVETLRVSLLNQEVTFGPVTFKGADAKAGEVGNLGLRINPRRLFQRQAMLTGVIIEGIRFDIRQTADGEIIINGVPLRQMLAQEGNEQKPENETPESEKKPWGAGLDSLKVRDSRIDFTDSKGGTISMRVNELDLDGFLSWRPEAPGQFRLEGDVNGIEVKAEGDATPFSNNINLDAKVDITGIELSKIEEYTGNAGFNPNAGTVDLHLETKSSYVAPDGHADAIIDGKIDVAGIDLVNPQVGAFKVDQASVTFNGLRLLVDPEKQVNLTGALKAETGISSFRLPDGTEIGFSAVTVDVPELTGQMPINGTPEIKANPTVSVTNLALGGPAVHGNFGTAKVTLTALDFDAGTTTMTTTGTVESSGFDLVIPLDKPITVKAGTVLAHPNALKMSFTDNRTLIDGPTDLVTTELLVDVPFKEPKPGRATQGLKINAKRFEGTLPTLLVDDQLHGADQWVTKVKVGGNKVKLDQFDLSVDVAAEQAVSVVSDALGIDSIDVVVDETEKTNVDVRAGLTSPAIDVGYGSTSKASPSEPTQVRLAGFSTALQPFVYHEEGPVSKITMAGSVRSEQTDVIVPATADQASSRVKLQNLRVGLTEAMYREAGTDLDWRTRFNLDLRGLDAAVNQGRLATVRVGPIQLSDADFSARPKVAFDRLIVDTLDATVTKVPETGYAATAPAQKADAAAPVKPASVGKKEADRRWPPADLPELRIGALALINGGRVKFVDETVTPHAMVRGDIRELGIIGLDSRRPGDRTDVRFKMAVNDAPFEIRGWMSPLKIKPDLDLRAELARFGLPAISGYVSPDTGLDMTGGTLDLRAKANMEAAQLDGNVHIRVADLSFVDRANTENTIFTKKVGLPLNTIISLLEDSDHSFDFDLPVSGDVLSPQFDYSDLFWTGLYRVVRALIVSPLKLISASTSLLSARGSGGGAEENGPISLPALAPIVFMPDQATFSDETRAQVTSLREVLRGRPGMTVNICGQAVGADIDALSPKAAKPDDRARIVERKKPDLQRLAEQRTLAVWQALVTDGGVNADQVKRCIEPAVMPDDPGMPRVVVGF